MELRELRTFVLVSELKSFSKAGQILFTTQPTVSKMIASLEAELGHELFIRKPHQLQLTDFGKSFLPYASEIINAENNAMTFISAQSDKPSVFLRIGMSRSLGTLPDQSFSIRMHRAIIETHRKNRDVFLSLDVLPDVELFEALREKKYDMIICPVLRYGENTSRLNDFSKVPLGDCRNFVVFPPNKPISKDPDMMLTDAGSVTSIDDFATTDLVALFTMTYHNLTQHRMAHNWYNLLCNVESDYAIGIVPEQLLPLTHSLGMQSIPLSDAVYEMNLMAVYPPDSEQTEIIRDFCSCFA